MKINLYRFCIVVPLFLSTLGADCTGVRVGRCTGAPGETVICPVSVSVRDGARLDTLSFGVLVVAADALSPALTAQLSYTPGPDQIESDVSGEMRFSPGLVARATPGSVHVSIPQDATPGSRYRLEIVNLGGGTEGATPVTPLSTLAAGILTITEAP